MGGRPQRFNESLQSERLEPSTSARERADSEARSVGTPRGNLRSALDATGSFRFYFPE